MAIPQPSRSRTLFPWVALLVGLGVTTWCWVLVRKAEQARIQGAFEAAASARVAMIAQRMATEEQILKGAAEFASQQGRLSRWAWRDYVSALELPRRYPGIQGLGYALWTSQGNLREHARRTRAEGFPDYRVRALGGGASAPEGAGAVVYLEPMDERNVRALGLDVWSEPARREALTRARDLGVVAATRPVHLVQDDLPERQAGVILYAPIYRHGLTLDSVADRRRALVGWTNLPLRMDDHILGTLGPMPEGLQIRVMEAGEAAPVQIFPSSAALIADVAKAWQGTRLIRSRTLEVAGRSWIIQAQADSRFTTARGEGTHWTFLIGGTLVSLLACLALVAMARSEARAERLADRRLEELTSSEARWKFAIEGAGDGLWDWDVASGRVYFSARWKAMLGYGEAEIGDTLQEWESRVHPEDLPQTQAAIRRHLAGETASYQSEHRLKCKDGSYTWILDRGMVVQRTADGLPVRVIGTHSDLTERRNAEAALREAHKAEGLGLMAAGIAHDFNNLFQSLLGNLELAHLRSDPAGRQIIDRARHSLDKASGLSRRLLEFSGGSFTHLGTLSVNALVRSVVDAHASMGPVRAMLDLDSQVPEVVADPQQVRQVLDILLENALEAVGTHGGAVTLSSEWLPGLPESERTQGVWTGELPAGPLVRITIADTGGGAGPEVMTRLFDPFFSTKALGRGLGLPSALGLIRGNRAGLQVVDRPGEGMTFRIYLSAERREVRRDGASSCAPVGGGRAVLVVDDEMELRQVLCEALRDCHGCQVFEAADGVEAIEVFQAHRDEIGLVLMDSIMPRMKGPEAYDEIRRIQPGIPGILISGFSEGKGQDLAHQHGFSAFLKKPFPLKHLTDLMADIQSNPNDAGESGGTYS